MLEVLVGVSMANDETAPTKPVGVSPVALYSHFVLFPSAKARIHSALHFFLSTDMMKKYLVNFRKRYFT